MISVFLFVEVFFVAKNIQLVHVETLHIELGLCSQGSLSMDSVNHGLWSTIVFMKEKQKQKTAQFKPVFFMSNCGLFLLFVQCIIEKTFLGSVMFNNVD